MPEGLLSSHLVNGLAPGTIVRLALPEGDFVLPDPPPDRMLFLVGGPSQLDTFDPKPAAPPEVRGPFGTVPTTLPGLRVCEHLPRLARMMHRLCLIRTISHRYNSHNPYAVMTGFTGGNDREDYFARPSNYPSMGSVCRYFGLGRRRDLPPYVLLPAYPGYVDGLRRAGPPPARMTPARLRVMTVLDSADAPALATKKALAEAAANGTRDQHAFSQVVRRTVGRWVNSKHRRRPMIVPVVIEA